jgi:flagellar hook assembly protein FlgD
VDLSFTLSRPGDAVLTIFDPQGRRVRRLAYGASSAGTQRVQWDGRDDAGRLVCGGMYFVKLEAEGRALRARLARVR